MVALHFPNVNLVAELIILVYSIQAVPKFADQLSNTLLTSHKISDKSVKKNSVFFFV
jgi:hypothetical protein